MAKKFKKAQDKELPAVKRKKTSITKKQRKKKDNESLNGTCKNDLEKPSTSKEIVKNTFINKQNSKKKKKHGSKNKFDIENTERSDVSTKRPKDNKKTSEVIQKVQINTKSQTKHKTNKRQRQNMNLDHTKKDAVRVNAKERKKKLQMPAKKSIDLEHRKTKVEKLKKMNEKKMKQMLVKTEKTETQQIKSNEILKLNKQKIKIKQLEEMLVCKLQKTKILRDKMIIQSRASKFRLINEMLYNNSSSQSKRYFKEDPVAFKTYHAGYNWQLLQWMNNSLDVIISSIMELPIDYVIADFGCGEARLAASVPHTVHSFDFIALNNRVKTCDIAHTPLRKNSVHVAVFCLSLMGSNLKDYIIEANRVLKTNGILKIAEIESRFEDVRDFIRLLRSYGFKNTWKDFSDNIFYFMDFKKEKDINKREILPAITLKSCWYKKR